MRLQRDIRLLGYQYVNVNIEKILTPCDSSYNCCAPVNRVNWSSWLSRFNHIPQFFLSELAWKKPNLICEIGPSCVCMCMCACVCLHACIHLCMCVCVHQLQPWPETKRPFWSVSNMWEQLITVSNHARNSSRLLLMILSPPIPKVHRCHVKHLHLWKSKWRMGEWEEAL